MSALKMFFCMLSDNGAIDVTVHRELNSIYTLWSNEKMFHKVGIIHIGFMRPKVPNFDEVEHFKENILVSSSVKWALPAEYRTSNQVVNNSKIPLYQLLSGFGYDIKLEDDQPVMENAAIQVASSKAEPSHTIASAALEVLESTSQSMSKEEIYGYIIERNLFDFGAKKPISVLNVELNRYCKDTDYSHSSSNKIFGKTSNGLFYALSAKKEFTGWLKALQDESPSLENECVKLLVFDDKTFLEKRHEFNDQVSRELDLIRFEYLKLSIDAYDPSQLIPILPKPILDAHISQLGLTVRTSNVFSIQNIFCLRDALGIKLTDMLKWPNFGKKSAKDLCELLSASVKKLTFQLPNSLSKSNIQTEPLNVNNQPESENEGQLNDYTLEHIRQVPLKQHFENSLELLSENARLVLEYRTGYKEPIKTLEEVGRLVGVTRERIRQIQKQNIKKIIDTEYWDDCIAIKIGNLLMDRDQPLYLEMLEVEDDWFSGFFGNYQHLAAIIELFSENQIQLLTINGAVVISRINQDDWNNLISGLRKSLKAKADENQWTREDINLIFKSELETKGAVELLSKLWYTFSDTLQFSLEGDVLIAYGKTGESAVFTVLQQAEGPLHYSEVATRATEVLGRKVEERLAHNSLPRAGAKLFGRGIYGLPKFNPISDLICKHIRVVLSKMIYEGPLAKQWHVTELLTYLKEKFPALPQTLDMYILNIILEDCHELTYLNKNVWARADSGQKPTDRVDMADAFTKILEDAGTPLKGREIKARLEAVRGVHESLQIQPTERMLQVGPDTWGLYERDIKISSDSINIYLDNLYSFLRAKQKGIHVTEVPEFLDEVNLDLEIPESYTLLSLAQQDKRFYMGRAMFLGLTEWGEDTRRYTNSQAVRKILDEMTKPMSIMEINAKVHSLTGIDTATTVTGILINEGAKYYAEQRVWYKE
jgi:hypothetical protein